MALRQPRKLVLGNRMNDKLGLVVLMAAASGCAILTIAGFFYPAVPSAKWLSTASGLLGLASILQLKISGWFEEVTSFYGDAKKFPYGPPSHVTRQIISNPDHPLQANFRDWLFFEPKTGIRMGAASITAALFATWI